VIAGGDQYLGESGIAQLEGKISGENVNSIVWSKASGPGVVSWGDASSAGTSAGFSQPGIYELKLEVADGFGIASDSVIVRVVDPADVVRAINCGGGTYSGVNGFNYEADGFFTGGHIDSFSGNAVANTADDALYHSARSGQSAYTVPLADGDYTVLLQFAETFFTAGNKRVFSTTIEGSLVIGDLDLFATAPGKWVAYDRVFRASVTGGQLDLGFSASVNNALLNGFVVLRD
jgi:hypothetical protein